MGLRNFDSMTRGTQDTKGSSLLVSVTFHLRLTNVQRNTCSSCEECVFLLPVVPCFNE